MIFPPVSGSATSKDYEPQNPDIQGVAGSSQLSVTLRFPSGVIAVIDGKHLW
jgi:hypothetical protein